MWAFLSQNGNLVSLEVPSKKGKVKQFFSYDLFTLQDKRNPKKQTPNNQKTTEQPKPHSIFAFDLIYFPWISISMHYGLHEA